MPVFALPKLVFSLISWAVLAAGLWLLWRWYEGAALLYPDGATHRVYGPGWMLGLGAVLLVVSLFGRFLVLALLPAAKFPMREETGTAVLIDAPDGGKLQVVTEGPAGAPTLVFTHGWGLGVDAWAPIAALLSDRYRLVLWDLPGIGGSSAPHGGHFSLDGFARALGQVTRWSGAEPVVLVGHSIGGMTSQTLWRACPELQSRIAGIALLDTTFHNPLETMALAPIWRATQKPLVEPLNWLVFALSPLFWLSAWQSYLSGGAHLATRLVGFGRCASRGAVELTTRLACRASPGVQAKGNLAMIHWSVASDLPSVTPPVLALMGSKDIITLPHAGEIIAGTVPNGRCVVVEGCGHMGLVERPEVYAAHIAAFAEGAFAG